MATSENMEIEGEPSKPYRLYRVGLDDEIISLVADGNTLDHLKKRHTRRLDWKYAVYHNGKRISP